MVRKYKETDREAIADFFAMIIRADKSYISHGEMQMGIATDRGTLSEDFRSRWLIYLDIQANNPQTTIFINEDKGKIAGFAIAGTTSDGFEEYGVIYDMGVDPSVRGKGFGKELMRNIMKMFADKNIKDCYLESGIHNDNAHNFFEKYDFEKVSYVFHSRLKK